MKLPSCLPWLAPLTMGGALLFSPACAKIKPTDPVADKKPTHTADPAAEGQPKSHVEGQPAGPEVGNQQTGAEGQPTGAQGQPTGGQGQPTGKPPVPGANTGAQKAPLPTVDTWMDFHFESGTENPLKYTAHVHVNHTWPTTFSTESWIYMPFIQTGLLIAELKDGEKDSHLYFTEAKARETVENWNKRFPTHEFMLLSRIIAKTMEHSTPTLAGNVLTLTVKETKYTFKYDGDNHMVGADQEKFLALTLPCASLHLLKQSIENTQQYPLIAFLVDRCSNKRIKEMKAVWGETYNGTPYGFLQQLVAGIISREITNISPHQNAENKITINLTNLGLAHPFPPSLDMIPLPSWPTFEMDGNQAFAFSPLLLTALYGSRSIGGGDYLTEEKMGQLNHEWESRAPELFAIIRDFLALSIREAREVEPRKPGQEVWLELNKTAGKITLPKVGEMSDQSIELSPQATQVKIIPTLYAILRWDYLDCERWMALMASNAAGEFKDLHEKSAYYKGFNNTCPENPKVSPGNVFHEVMRLAAEK